MNLKQLSLELGLSQTTVSRALNGYPEVSEATRIRVQQAAEQYEYAPSTRAKGLATGKALAIGHVIPIDSNHEMVNPIFADFIAGAGEVYARNGYEMVLTVMAPDMDEATIYRRLQSRRAVDGVVVHGPAPADSRIPLLLDLNLPFVVHGRSTDITASYAYLDVNNRRAFRRATDYLYDLGHRRFGLINGREDKDFAQRRRAGFEDSLLANGLSLDAALMANEEMTEDYGYATMRDWLTHDTPPTAIVSASIITALGIRRAIEETGRVMGRDISVVTHDDVLSYMRNGGDVPIFTSTRSSVRHAGSRVAEILMTMIADPTQPPITEMLEAELVVGQSTGPAPQ